MKIRMEREYEVHELTTEELLGRLRQNRSDRRSNWSYHGLRTGIVAEQEAVIAELTRRGRRAETEGFEIR